jgi:hypothetical protein
MRLRPCFVRPVAAGRTLEHGLEALGELNAFIERIYNALGPTYTEAELREPTRLAHLRLTPEQQEAMLPELKRRQAVYRSVDFE